MNRGIVSGLALAFLLSALCIPAAARITHLQPSLEERYGSHDEYVERVSHAAHHLQQRRFLLPDDVQRYIDAAAASNVLQ